MTLVSMISKRETRLQARLISKGSVFHAFNAPIGSGTQLSCLMSNWSIPSYRSRMWAYASHWKALCLFSRSMRLHPNVLAIKEKCDDITIITELMALAASVNRIVWVGLRLLIISFRNLTRLLCNDSCSVMSSCC